MATIELDGIHKRFRAAGPRPRLETMWIPPVPREAAAPPRDFSIEGLSLTIPDGKTTVVVGPSGCGKTTLLRLVAGLDKPDAGAVRYDGVDMADVPPKDRGIGMVFQNYALFPHLAARQNVLMHFLFRKQSPATSAEADAKLRRTSELLGVEIDWLLDKSPSTLSGGEKQRVAVGRCLTRDPRLFLMDEPFSNLDAKLRERYRLQLKRLLHEFAITALYVTHDQLEARILADTVVVMRDGRVEQVGEYEAIYAGPASAFVADFLNVNPETPAINLVPGSVLDPSLAGCTVGFRCEDADVLAAAAPGAVAGTVVHVARLPFGAGAVYCLRGADGELYAEHPAVDGLGEGDAAWLRPRRYHVFDAATGARLETRGDLRA